MPRKSTRVPVCGSQAPCWGCLGACEAFLMEWHFLRCFDLDLPDPPGERTLSPWLTRAVLLTVRDEAWANFCCLVYIGLNMVRQALVLFGMETPKWKRSFISLLFCTCMHPLKRVLILVFCAPWREMRMKVVGICRKDLRGECLVLHYSLHSWDRS